MGNTLSTPGGITTTAPLAMITEMGSTLPTPHESNTTTQPSTIEELMSELLTLRGTNITGRGLFRLPPELRNVIYEYVLADVQDNVCIDLGAGLNKVYRAEAQTMKLAQKPEPVLNNNKASHLGMLLACKQINREATGIAYSKMSMSFETVSLDMETSDYFVLEKESDRLRAMLGNFVKTFDVSKSSPVTTLVLHGSRVLTHLVHTNWRVRDRAIFAPSCTARCPAFIHETYHNIRCIILDVTNDGNEIFYRALSEGAPWLSVALSSWQVSALLSTFPSHEQIVVRRECGEQATNVINGGLFAAESGMPLRGVEDFIR